MPYDLYAIQRAAMIERSLSHGPLPGNRRQDAGHSERCASAKTGSKSNRQREAARALRDRRHRLDRVKREHVGSVESVQVDVASGVALVCTVGLTEL